MKNSVVYFSLTPSLYAAQFDNSIILLNSTTDNYISLIDEAAHYLTVILKSRFFQNVDGKYTIEDNHETEDINFWIAHFLEQQFIMQSNKENTKVIGYPLKPGGLCDYRWSVKPSHKPFANTSLWGVIKALVCLIRVHYIMKRSNMKGLLALISSNARQNRHLKKPTMQKSNKLAAAIDAATLLYPKKTFCLAWAVTYVCMSLKNGRQAQLVIGVQTNPFYAHAWAESGGNVIHDDPTIAQVLSIILRTPL